MSLKYEPASLPQHISVEWLLNLGVLAAEATTTSHMATVEAHYLTKMAMVEAHNLMSRPGGCWKDPGGRAACARSLGWEEAAERV